MIRLDTPEAMASWSRQAQRDGETIAFVPTMGYLHDGHLSLMREARKRGTKLVASIFVNPLQFGPNEDLATYPRDADGDAAKCRSVGVDALFFPTPQSMYPAGFQTTVRAGALGDGLCGASRPGHFDGVCTVVLKLFHLVRPQVAVFGRKDFQQLAIIRRMVRDLAVDVQIVGGAIVREPDGLAMSSRNAYLSAEERAQALVLSRSLAAAAEAFGAGERSASALLGSVREAIEARPLAAIDYVSLVDEQELQPLAGDHVDRPALLALAVRFGRTRLIDNTVLGEPA